MLDYLAPIFTALGFSFLIFVLTTIIKWIVMEQDLKRVRKSLRQFGIEISLLGVGFFVDAVLDLNSVYNEATRNLPYGNAITLSFGLLFIVLFACAMRGYLSAQSIAQGRTANKKKRAMQRLILSWLAGLACLIISLSMM